MLLTTAIQIFDKNTGCVLAGSLSLKWQGFNIRREAKDIDIHVPSGVGFVYPDIKWDEEDDTKYPEDDRLKMITGYIDDIKVNVFYEHSKFPFDIIEYRGVKCVAWYDTIKAKLKYCLDNSVTKWKHRDDLLHFLINNTDLNDKETNS